MGVISRKVWPVCENLCCLCPSLRARSRQPVKRYKKILKEIFLRSQVGEPNDRMIGKLCEYSSRNPMRLPKITQYLDSRCYKALRNGQLSLAKVVPCIYAKLLASCKEHMPLYAASVMGIIQTLLEQTREDDMRVMGCLLVVSFLDCQMDSTYMFYVEGLVPKLCQLGQEVGGDDRGLQLRSAGLQALSSLVLFMGKHSHILMDFDDIVSVVLENYEIEQVDFEDDIQEAQEGSSNQKRKIEEVASMEDHALSFQDSWKRVLSLKQATSVEIDAKVDMSKSPVFWSKVCLCNMAKISREVITVRRVLQSLLRKFDIDNYWSPEKGIAYAVLSEVQIVLEESGQKGDLLFSTLIRHLDHKNVSGKPVTQANIVNVATYIARNSKVQASFATISSLTELIRQLRKCLQKSMEVPNLQDDANKCNYVLHFCIEACIMVLANKVGDMGPILDTLSVLLENIPSTTNVARATISSVYRTAQLAAAIPNLSYQKKVFPEELFHHLLVAMTHPDHGTRVGSHRVFSAILAPLIVCPWSIPIVPFPCCGYDPEGTLFVALSAYSSSGSRLDMLAAKSSAEKGIEPDIERSESDGVESKCKDCGQHNWISQKSLLLKSESKRNSGLPFFSEVIEGRSFTIHDEGIRPMRLSSHQVDLLLSSIWAQATSPDNTPVNYEALAHSYALTLLFARTKNSGQVALVRSFQLAFSLRSIALDPDSYLKPSRRRSLCTLAACMLILSAMACDVPEFISATKSIFEKEMVDPHLSLTEDNRLKTVHVEHASSNEFYGSEEDDISSLSSLEKLEKDGKQLKEIIITHVTKRFENLPKWVSLREQLFQEFSPNDDVALGAPMEVLHPRFLLAKRQHQPIDEAVAPAILEDKDPSSEAFRIYSNWELAEPLNSSDVLSINQLMESVTETGQQVADLPTSTITVLYDQMKSECEALVMGKLQKMSVIQSFRHQHEDSNVLHEENLGDAWAQFQCAEEDLKLVENEHTQHCDSLSSDSKQFFRLPPAIPYDKFLKAAGW